MKSGNRDKSEGASMDKRSKYLEKLSAQIVEWDVQIGRLRDKAEKATDGEKLKSEAEEIRINLMNFLSAFPMEEYQGPFISKTVSNQ